MKNLQGQGILFLLSSFWSTPVRGFVSLVPTFLYSHRQRILAKRKTLNSPSVTTRWMVDGGDDLVFDDNLFLSANDDDTTMGSSGVELWLDLRGTAIHPRAAVEYLEEQLTDELDDNNGLLPSSSILLWDRVILADTMFQNLVNSDDEFVQTSDILYSPQEKPNTIALSRTGLSFPFGELVESSDDGSVAVADPIKAMEVLASKKWVILCQNNDNDVDEESSRITAVGGFLDIASTVT